MAEKRLDQILAYLKQNGRVRVNDLSEQLNCSEVTIRSDLKKLEERGLAKRVHGGAVKGNDLLSLPFTSGNIEKNKEEKRRIARQAYEYIEDQDTIILDDASVNYYLAECIREDSSKTLIVITNSLVCAGMLADIVHVELFLVGGQIGGKLPAAMGDVAVNTLANFRANKAFISAHGINFSAGVTSIGSPQMQVKKAILKSSDQVYLLVDSSKFGGGYILVVCPLSRITRIITDTGISEDDLKRAKEQNVPIDVV